MSASAPDQAGTKESCEAGEFPVNFYELVPFLLNENPSWTESDIVELVEEKTRQPLSRQNHEALGTVFHRCLRLEAEFGERFPSSPA